MPVLDAEEAACRRRTPPFPLGSAPVTPPWPQPSSGTRLCVEGGFVSHGEGCTRLSQMATTPLLPTRTCMLLIDGQPNERGLGPSCWTQILCFLRGCLKSACSPAIISSQSARPVSATSSQFNALHELTFLDQCLAPQGFEEHHPPAVQSRDRPHGDWSWSPGLAPRGAIRGCRPGKTFPQWPPTQAMCAVTTPTFAAYSIDFESSCAYVYPRIPLLLRCKLLPSRGVPLVGSNQHGQGRFGSRSGPSSGQVSGTTPLRQEYLLPK